MDDEVVGERLDDDPLQSSLASNEAKGLMELHPRVRVGADPQRSTMNDVAHHPKMLSHSLSTPVRQGREVPPVDHYQPKLHLIHLVRLPPRLRRCHGEAGDEKRTRKERNLCDSMECDA